MSCLQYPTHSPAGGGRCGRPPSCRTRGLEAGAARLSCREACSRWSHRPAALV